MLKYRGAQLARAGGVHTSAASKEISATHQIAMTALNFYLGTVSIYCNTVLGVSAASGAYRREEVGWLERHGARAALGHARDAAGLGLYKYSYCTGA